MDEDRGLTMKRLVKVWEGDEPCEITVVQKSKSVWIAAGEYMGSEPRGGEYPGRVCNTCVNTGNRALGMSDEAHGERQGT